MRVHLSLINSQFLFIYLFIFFSHATHFAHKVRMRMIAESLDSAELLMIVNKFYFIEDEWLQGDERPNDRGVMRIRGMQGGRHKSCN